MQPKYPIWSVQSVQPQQDYTLIVTFITGEKKVYDCKPLFHREIFKPLQNLELFFKAHSNGITVVWNDELDIAPECLYEDGVPLQ